MDTKSLIISASKEEFMEVGFQEASMRKIASKVGITAMALYRHYVNMEEIFDAMWQDKEQARSIVDMIYKDFDAHKLLFCRSKGTKYENYLHGSGVHINQVDEKEMHLLLSAQYSARKQAVSWKIA